MSRKLNPTESIVLSSVIAPMSTKQIAHIASQRAGRELPRSTVSASLSNLCRWGLLAKEAKPNLRRNASRMIYRRVWP